MFTNKYYSTQWVADIVERRFERFFLLSMLFITALFFYLPQKMAVLNFYYIPVIVTGYFRGVRLAIGGAILSILLVMTSILVFSDIFIYQTNKLDIYMQIYYWGIFIVLAGGIVGKQRSQLKEENDNIHNLNNILITRQSELENANNSLQSYNDKFRDMVQELELSKHAIESLKVKVEETLYSTMDSTVAKLMIEDRLRNEKRNVSVMFTDLAGYTNYAEEKSPEVVIRDLNNYIKSMEPIILKYKGHIDKYLGDGIMCEFGAPVDYERARVLAVLAALKMQENLRRLDFPWKMRIGLAYGSVITGLVGSKRQSYTTIGDTVNLASRIEKVCPEGSILIDEMMNEEVARFFDTRHLKDLHPVEGTDEKLDRQLDDLRKKLTTRINDAEKAGIYLNIGLLYLSNEEPYDALSYLERGMFLDPDNRDLKVAFAEATLKKEQRLRLKVKGRMKRVTAYEVTGLKSIYDDRNKFSSAFLTKYPSVDHLIDIPEDIVLPVEAVDGCIRHSLGVAHFAYAVASEMNMYESEMKKIVLAAYMADIGKEIIHHHLLNRFGGLTDRELKEVRKHPLESVRILMKMGYEDDQVLECVKHSHENFNGSGYPDGLKGEGIPFGSRIINICDTYDALTSWRPYREAWERDVALDEIRRGVDKGLFDPKIAAVLMGLLS